ncbi:MAG: hypothetical protein JNM99_05335 [Verrucomicrobiaceae bacterium]|nr:hypothetical protein [Verrucomicrobiaceae bacterium]
MKPSRLCLALASLLVFAGSGTSSQAQTPVVATLADFDGVAPGLTKGNGPRGSLIFGADGNLYGTTEFGGAAAGAGFGSIFKMSPGGTFTTMADLGGATDGSRPKARLLRASDGNFYGTTSAGGPDSLGTIFQMTPAGVVSVVHTFTTLSRKDMGATPTDALIEGTDGYLYGTTSSGGLNGYGTVFKVQPTVPSTPIRLVDFTGNSGTKRGSLPSGLMQAKDGNFYGTTESGGLYGNGTVFRLTPAGVFTTIADFGSSAASYTGPTIPRSPLIQASNGLLYGTSAAGGTGGQGTVYSITTAGAYKALVNFTGSAGPYLGRTPEAPLIQATDGNLYGTTRLGGASNRGTIFRVSTTGVFTNLIQFTGTLPSPGAEPRGGLLQDNEGFLYGTTSTSGLNGMGTVFQLSNALPLKATVFTNGLSALFSTRATLTGSINPQGTTALYWFEYGPTTNYGSRMPVAPTTSSAGAGRAFVDASASLTGLIPSSTYHYRLVCMNGGGTSWGDDQTFITGPNPNIVTPPTDKLVGVGQPSSFTVDAIGAALKYAWLKAGTAAPIGAAATYSIASTALTHAGTYSVKVSDGLDSVQTAPVRLGVISLANSSPVVNQRMSIALTLPQAGPGLTFQWKTAADDLPVPEGGRITGTKTASLQITNAQGSDEKAYYCEVTLGSLPPLKSGNFNLDVKLIPEVVLPVLGPWTTNGDATGSVTALNDGPMTFRAVGLPEGVAVSPAGVISGKPKAAGTYNIYFYAKNVAGESPQMPVPATVIVVPASANASGDFAGTVARDSSFNSNLGGRFTLNLTAVGTGSGSLIHLGKTFGFSAKLSPAPGATRSLIITPTVAAGFPAVTATLTEATGEIAGSVNGATLTAKRNAGNPGTKAGIYNVVFSPTSADAGNPLLPQGSGHGTITVAATGVVTWTGTFKSGTTNVSYNKLGDGALISGTSYLASDGTIPWHFPLYAIGTGSAQGWMMIDGSNVITEQSFDWLKLNQTAASRSYQTGFALHQLEIDGGKYAKPGTGVHVLGLSGSTSNAKIVFTDGGLSAPLTQVINFPATNIPTITLANPNTVKLTIDLNTGYFSGTFVIPDAVPANVRTVAYSGVLIPGLQQGIGQFQLPQLPNPTTSALLSGRVVLSANP